MAFDAALRAVRTHTSEQRSNVQQLHSSRDNRCATVPQNNDRTLQATSITLGIAAIELKESFFDRRVMLHRISTCGMAPRLTVPLPRCIFRNALSSWNGPPPMLPKIFSRRSCSFSFMVRKGTFSEAALTLA